MNVAAILKRKGYDVVSVPPELRVADVIDVLADKGIGAALVRDAAGQVLGIVSERDVVRALARHGAAVLDMAAARLMTADIRTCSPGTGAGEAFAMMTEGRFRHLPVMEHGALVGLVSIGDVVKLKLDEQALEMDSLKAYVAGGA